MDMKRKIFVSIICGLIMTIVLSSTALIKDNSVICKVIYDYNQNFQDEPYLYIYMDDSNIEIVPNSPLSDTYNSWYTIFEESYEISYTELNADGFKLELLQDSNNIANISSLEIYNHGYQVLKLSPTEINSLFDTDGLEAIIKATKLQIIGNGSEISIQANDKFLEILSQIKTANSSLYCNSLFWGMIIALLIYILLGVEIKYFKLPWRDIIYAIILSVVFVIVCCMALFSKHYSHPDETVTRMAIDYYLSGWRRPDVNSSFASGTFSNYGHSRLKELNLYYLLAGKFVWLFREYFNISTYYRMFNVLLLGIMLLFSWKKRNSDKWMSVALLMTPQLWYICSYSTSDAWDWFCGFVMIYMILHKDKLLYNSISDNIKSKKILVSCFKYGIIFAMILLGKSNYLVLLGVAFVDFLLGMFREKKSDQIVRKFVIYMLILLITFSFKWVVSRIPLATPSISYVENDNSSNKLNVKYERKEEYSDLLTFSSPRENGYSFWYTMWNYGRSPAPVILFDSFTGVYMWMMMFGRGIYYKIMAGVYLIIILNIIAKWIKDKRNHVLDIKIISSMMICLAVVTITLLYCWNKTYQPQGRYCLAIPLIIGYAYAQYGKLLEERFTKTVIAICAIMGIWSFTVYGLLTMYLSGYMMIG
jgi:hypothetical protein